MGLGKRWWVLYWIVELEISVGHLSLLSHLSLTFKLLAIWPHFSIKTAFQGHLSSLHCYIRWNFSVNLFSDLSNSIWNVTVIDLFLHGFLGHWSVIAFFLFIPQILHSFLCKIIHILTTVPEYIPEFSFSFYILGDTITSHGLNHHLYALFQIYISSHQLSSDFQSYLLDASTPRYPISISNSACPKPESLSLPLNPSLSQISLFPSRCHHWLSKDNRIAARSAVSFFSLNSYPNKISPNGSRKWTTPHPDGKKKIKKMSWVTLPG